MSQLEYQRKLLFIKGTALVILIIGFNFFGDEGNSEISRRLEVKVDPDQQEDQVYPNTAKPSPL